MFAFLCFHVVAAVPNAEVQPTIGPNAQPMHVVAAKGDSHTEAVSEACASVGDTIVVAVIERPHVWDARVVDASASSQHTCASAIHDVVEPIREDLGVVDFAIAVGVGQKADAVVVFGIGVGLVSEVLAEHGQSFIHRLQGEIVV